MVRNANLMNAYTRHLKSVTEQQEKINKRKAFVDGISNFFSHGLTLRVVSFIFIPTALIYIVGWLTDMPPREALTTAWQILDAVKK